MKRNVILCVVACALYGSTLLAIGIYLAQFDLADLFAQMLAEKIGILALIFGIALALPLILIRLIPIFFILFGALYILTFAQTAHKFYKGDLPWLYKRLHSLRLSHYGLFVLIFIADCIIFPYMFVNIQNGVSVALIVFTVLINVTAIAFEVSTIVAVEKLKKYLYA